MKKKIIALFAVVCAALSLAAFAACNSKNSTTEYSVEVSTRELVVFIAPETSSQMSVKDYMDGLVENNLITYTISGGMVTSLNGTSNTADYSSCWMFYSDLDEMNGVIYGNAEWGTYEYGEKTLVSCTYGVEDMPLVSGYTYAAVYTTF